MIGHPRFPASVSVHLSITALATGLLSVGCGGSGSERYSGPWGQASGVVRLDGKPIAEEALITFLSPDGLAVSGQVNASGEFRLKYNGSNDVPVGSYNVGITSRKSGGFVSEDPADYFNDDGSTKVVENAESIIDTKFHSPGTSGLVIQITEGPNDLKIDIDP